MQFNSITFGVFFTAFFLPYWLACARNLRAQNVLLLAGSYVFYAWADWRLLPLLIVNSLVFFELGIFIHRSRDEKSRRGLLLLGVTLGLGELIFFKYTAFLVESVAACLSAVGITLGSGPIHLVLPLGISFFTFRTLGYLIDIHRGKLEPSRDWIVFFSYVAFFPSMVSGPIDKPKALILQLEKKRIFDYDTACDGMRQMAWGLFKKVVVADNCAIITDQVFGSYRELPASTLLLGAFVYSIQIYADFSGYSEMAVGLARLLGFSIIRNFDYPFFAQNIAEFWRKWNISLTAWFTEYLFTPLNIAFRDMGKAGMIMAIIVNFTIIGIWHGANWNFVLFGLLHGCLFIPLVLRGTVNRKVEIAQGRLLPGLAEAWRMLLTFSFVTFAFVVFRSASIGDAVEYFKRLASAGVWSVPVLGRGKIDVFFVLIALSMLVVEWLNRGKPYALAQLGLGWPRPVRWCSYYAGVWFMFLCAGHPQNFIYFQF